ADTSNNRILKFNTTNLVTGGTANVTLGQTTFTSSSSGTSATKLKSPNGLAFDSNGNLWVADTSNNRILKFNTTNLVTGGTANVTLGQTTFTSSSSGTSATQLNSPFGLAFDSHGNLWVADQNSNRILKFNTTNLVTGGTANVTLGQTTFTSSSSGTSATQLSGPNGLAFDSNGNLWVADENNLRLLMYPTSNLVTGGAATVALGTINLVSIGPGTSALTFSNTLRGLTFDSHGNLWTTESAGNRILKFNTTNLVTGGTANVTLGQTTFTSSSSGTSATQLNAPQKSIFDSHGNLWVADTSNNRILKFNTTNLVTGGTANVTLGQTSLTSSGSSSAAARLAS
ncbi:MAG: NHL repeat-containing protein, partial [Thaumarchaeota archaeon]|nr:NHL repeat-containing protein [Nitrososphaerota archaeon]